MSESAPRKDPPEITSVHDPDVRRALRAMYNELHTTIEHHQIEIQALLELMLEKHVGSIGEYKRHLTRLQQGGVGRSERIHGQMTGTANPAPPHGQTPRERLGG
jgi:hypothetical protein